MKTEIYRIEHDGGGYEEVTAGELDRAAAGREVDRMVKLYQRDHPHATYQEGMRRVLAAHPGLKVAYARGIPSVPDQLRLAGATGAAEYAVQHGTVTYIVDQYPVPAAPSSWETFIVPAGTSLELGYPTGRPIWTPLKATFAPARWSAIEAERWLNTVGLKAKVMHVERDPQNRPISFWALVSDEAFEDFPRRTIRG